MDRDVINLLVWLAAIAFIVLVLVSAKRGRRGSRPGPGTVGTVYDWLNEDKRKAVELIVESRAEATDPEHKDGNLPELEDPRR